LEDTRESYGLNQPDSDDSGQSEDVVNVARVFPVPNSDHLASTDDRNSTTQSRGMKRDSREIPAPKYDFHDDSDDVRPRTTASQKGLFSVSTTSTKSVPVIRVDVTRVLRQLGVDRTDVRAGFSCRHVPTINLKKVVDLAPSGSVRQRLGHRRRITSGGLNPSKSSDRTRKGSIGSVESLRSYNDFKNRSEAGGSFTNSEASNDSKGGHRNGSHIQSEFGGSMILEFAILIAKFPLLLLYGIQFKRVGGKAWQYKDTADQIPRELRL
jgi:hypothetical protein